MIHLTLIKTIRYVNNKGWTPLIYAVSEDNVELLELFIQHELAHPTSEKFPTKAYRDETQIDSRLCEIFISH